MGGPREPAPFQQLRAGGGLRPRGGRELAPTARCQRLSSGSAGVWGLGFSLPFLCLVFFSGFWVGFLFGFGFGVFFPFFCHRSEETGLPRAQCFGHDLRSGRLLKKHSSNNSVTTTNKKKQAANTPGKPPPPLPRRPVGICGLPHGAAARWPQRDTGEGGTGLAGTATGAKAPVWSGRGRAARGRTVGAAGCPPPALSSGGQTVQLQPLWQPSVR